MRLKRHTPRGAVIWCKTSLQGNHSTVALTGDRKQLTKVRTDRQKWYRIIVCWDCVVESSLLRRWEGLTENSQPWWPTTSREWLPFAIFMANAMHTVRTLAVDSSRNWWGQRPNIETCNWVCQIVSSGAISGHQPRAEPSCITKNLCHLFRRRQNKHHRQRMRCGF